MLSHRSVLLVLFSILSVQILLLTSLYRSLPDQIWIYFNYWDLEEGQRLDKALIWLNLFWPALCLLFLKLMKALLKAESSKLPFVFLVKGFSLLLGLYGLYSLMCSILTSDRPAMSGFWEPSSLFAKLLLLFTVLSLIKAFSASNQEGRA